MELQLNTSTQLRRYNSAIYAVKELLEAQKIDGYEFMIDTLMTSYYGIDDIVLHIENKQREDQIKRAQKYMEDKG
jgi:hypothetical protein